MDKKTTLIIFFIVFIIGYSLLWFFGGGCTSILGFPLTVNSADYCVSINAVSSFRNIPIFGLFFPSGIWNSITYFFMPLIGFILGIYFIGWFNSYFGTKFASSIFFLILILVALFAGYYISLFWFYDNIATLNSNANVDVGLYFCLDESTCNETVQALNSEFQAQSQQSSGKTFQLLPVNYWPLLRESYYFLFVIGLILAWTPNFAISLVEKKD